jgi:aminoglycoside 6'-N-acetyltransferase I
MASTVIRAAQHGDERAIAEMMALLWPEGTREEHRSDAAASIETGRCGTLPAIILVALDGRNAPIGFLQVGLRSHADGCDSAQPVGFIEGWFVRAEFRGQGIGNALMKAAEDWARTRDCVEMASDALIDNEERCVLTKRLASGWWIAVCIFARGSKPSDCAPSDKAGYGVGNAALSFARDLFSYLSQ